MAGNDLRVFESVFGGRYHRARSAMAVEVANPIDDFAELFLGYRLVQVMERIGLECFDAKLAVVAHEGERDTNGMKLVSEFQSIDQWHFDVQQSEIGVMVFAEAQKLIWVREDSVKLEVVESAGQYFDVCQCFKAVVDDRKMKFAQGENVLNG